MKNTTNKRTFGGYLFAIIILVIQYFILRYVASWDNGIFSWPRILIPNLWVMIGALAWYKFKPVGNFDLSYNFYSPFLIGLGIILSSALIAQLTMFPISIYERTPVSVLKFLTLSAIVPFSEELLYRGLLFHSLLRDTKNWFISALFVSIIFSILHLTQGSFVFVVLFFFSMILCYLADLTEGITSGIIVHICWNTLYYNKLLTSVPQRWTLNIIIIISILTICIYHVLKQKRNKKVCNL